MPARIHFFCTVPGCDRPHKTNGFCSWHAQRHWKHGDVMAHLPWRHPDHPIPGSVIIVDGVECWSVPLPKGREAIIDLENKWMVEPYRWHTSHGYAVRHAENDEGPKLYLHHMVLAPEPGYDVDHINRNRLDDRQCNLRQAEHFKNCFNSNLRKKKTSRFRGVHWDKRREYWVATIRSNGQSVNLGRFSNEDDAALAWNEAALERGEFAVFNQV